jgi:hypothetical protein
MSTPLSTTTATGPSPDSLPGMIRLRDLAPAQRKLFGYGANARNELDKLVPNPEKKKKVLPSPAKRKLRNDEAGREELTEPCVDDVPTGSIDADNSDPGKKKSHHRLYSSDRSNLDQIHVIFELIHCIDQNFVCVKCGQASSQAVERLTIGIATSLNFFCDCGHVCSMKGHLRSNGIIFLPPLKL